MTTPTPQVTAVADTLDPRHRLAITQHQITGLLEQRETLTELLEIMAQIGDSKELIAPRKDDLVRTLRMLKRYRAKEAQLIAAINGAPTTTEDSTP